jgi:hypothetical protein
MHDVRVIGVACDVSVMAAICRWIEGFKIGSQFPFVGKVPKICIRYLFQMCRKPTKCQSTYPTAPPRRPPTATELSELAIIHFYKKDHVSCHRIPRRLVRQSPPPSFVCNSGLSNPKCRASQLSCSFIGRLFRVVYANR